MGVISCHTYQVKQVLQISCKKYIWVAFVCATLHVSYPVYHISTKKQKIHKNYTSYKIANILLGDENNLDVHPSILFHFSVSLKQLVCLEQTWC